jgi:hypothetical protein
VSDTRINEENQLYFNIQVESRTARAIPLIFMVYGFIVGVLSVIWWHYSDNLFLINIPGIFFGDKIYTYSIHIFGDPLSPQAHFSIPWALRVPQVYVPVSTIFWIFIGLLVRIIYNRTRLSSDIFQQST